MKPLHNAKQLPLPLLANSAVVPSAPVRIDDTILFGALFSAAALEAVFEDEFASTTSKGVDRLNGFQFAMSAKVQLATASAKCLIGTYRFSPFLEVLKTKGRNKKPRLIGIPTVRDRVVLHQLNKFLATLYPERVPKNVASTYVREISIDLKGKSPTETWICSTDIKTFYDSIQRSRLLKVLAKRIKSQNALKLIGHALATPTVPKNTKRAKHPDYRTDVGVPQGLAISNILASIYMQEVDDVMPTTGITYYRYVDDVLMYGDHDAVEKAFVSLRARLRRRGLSLHPIGSGKSHLQQLFEPFGYLGYTFHWPLISVRDSTTERFLQSIAAKFSDYTHNKTRRLERFKYLTTERLKEIFVLELNERITGAISQKKRYGWIAYFNQISDLKLLHRLDKAIEGMFKRLPDFGNTAPADLKKLRRAYFEMKFNPQGGYVRDYDKIATLAEMLALLTERGRVGPEEALTDEQIKDRYEKYLQHILAAMHKDEGALYG
ncbi:reverse transcriptase domain-containing protein [Cupriavidus taiwanensis]|uniref:Putative Prophage PSPPH06, reverse transcript ase/maturase n=1 Tax=Cupriavidus taiwanensis TaxID=164546 RepID=A0A375J8L5_9BURK|nr:reverse transcriptase domain-containing protein [Cupriavidus taiwanensis]SPS01525.1 putative Prophage PSPPH06, reverse transcript ase/maturase [Cupriavidus taiwanensis]